MIESEGITENVKSWRTDVISQIMKALPQEKLMFEAADPQVCGNSQNKRCQDTVFHRIVSYIQRPQVFNWYIREFGIDVNLFVDHSQIVQLSCLRHGIWGMADTFGKLVSYRPGME